ncbi:hypothetical protein [Shewanella sp. Scap07]|uniref:hypothetical protein n=1 Tax=Shewanella sp. Scap07 TaxID=2589987 RepID=UPI0021190BAB|nr:hypothetical protein [Shewanella sp. Scap07]
MVVQFAAELIFWVVWELVLSVLFYTTGAVLLAIFSFGKIQKPLYLPAIFSREKRIKSKDFNAVCALGIVFYVVLFAALIYFY